MTTAAIEVRIPTILCWINHRLVTSDICYYNYLYFFFFISNANQILAQIDAAAGSDADKKAIKGQALAYRSWAYFMMIQLYGERFDKTKPNSGLGLPMRTEPTLGATPRVTVAEIYAQINKDIDESITLLGTVRRDRSHININVAKGFKARIALAQQNWSVLFPLPLSFLSRSTHTSIVGVQNTPSNANGVPLAHFSKRGSPWCVHVAVDPCLLMADF